MSLSPVKALKTGSMDLNVVLFSEERLERSLKSTGKITLLINVVSTLRLSIRIRVRFGTYLFRDEAHAIE